MSNLIQPSEDFAWPQLALDWSNIQAFLSACEDAGIEYGLGSKAPSLGAVPGKDFHAIDCSGFSRTAIFHGSAGRVVIPDGSANQHEYCIRSGFKESDYEGGLLHDGGIRIAFLTPEDGGGVGHVLLIHGGMTAESHGSTGPSSRAWDKDAHPFMGLMKVFVLTAPEAA